MKNLLSKAIAAFFILSIPFNALAATITNNDKISYEVHPNSITFYLDQITLDDQGEYVVACFSQGSLVNSAATSRSKEPKITLEGLNSDTLYTCSVKTVTFVENGGLEPAKIVGFTSDSIEITTGEKLRILEHSQGVDWAQVRVNAVDLAEDEIYFLECKTTKFDSEIVAPHAKSTEPTIKIENLEWFSTYNCRAGIGKNNSLPYIVNVSQKSENSIEVVTRGKEEIAPDSNLNFTDKTVKDWNDYSQPFPDVYFDSIWGKAAAELYRRGIVEGYPDGEFKGARNVNRAEASKFLLLARYKDFPDYTNTYQFADVLSGKWYTKYIMMAAQKDVIHGYDDGLFRPNNTVNTAEFIKMISRTFNLPKNLPYHYKDVPEHHWYAQYAGAVEKMNLFPDRKEYLFPHQKLSRYEVSVAIYQTLLYIEANGIEG